MGDVKKIIRLANIEVCTGCAQSTGGNCNPSTSWEESDGLQMSPNAREFLGEHDYSPVIDENLLRPRQPHPSNSIPTLAFHNCCRRPAPSKSDNRK